MKKVISLFLIFAMIFSFSACKKEEELSKYSETFYDAFDTVITITAFCKSEKEFKTLFNTAKEDFMKYHKLFDIYNSYEGITNLCTVNEKAGEEKVKVDDAIIDLLSFSQMIYEEKTDRVNIALGCVLRLWHDSRTYSLDNPDKAYIPLMDDLKEAANHCDIKSLVIDKENKTVYFADPKLKVDVGAIAKGFATELVAKDLISKGYDSILINAGGNVRTIGSKPTGNWIVGIQDPTGISQTQYVNTVSISNMSVVTSGVYERNFEVDGKVYHHIIDPDTLMPEDNFQSVTIATEDSALADAYSTAIFNMSFEDGKEFAEKNDISVMWIFNDKSLYLNEGFNKLVSK